MKTEPLSFADLVEQVKNQQQVLANKDSDYDEEEIFVQDDPLPKKISPSEVSQALTKIRQFVLQQENAEKALESIESIECFLCDCKQKKLCQMTSVISSKKRSWFHFVIICSYQILFTMIQI